MVYVIRGIVEQIRTEGDRTRFTLRVHHDRLPEPWDLPSSHVDPAIQPGDWVLAVAGKDPDDPDAEPITPSFAKMPFSAPRVGPLVSVESIQRNSVRLERTSAGVLITVSDPNTEHAWSILRQDSGAYVWPPYQEPQTLLPESFAALDAFAAVYRLAAAFLPIRPPTRNKAVPLPPPPTIGSE